MLTAILMGPVTIVFIFIWNIVGSVYLGKILASGHSTECISSGTAIINIMVQLLIYFFYLSIFYYAYIVIKAFKNAKVAKGQIEVNLKTFYKKLLQPKSDLKDEDVLELKKETQEFISDDSDNFMKLNLFEEEKEIIRLFSVPNAEIELPEKINQNIEIVTSKKKDNEKIDIEEPNRMTQPLFELIENTFEDQKLKKKMSKIQEKANPDEEECIICFSELNEENRKILLRCNHKFHDTCIFDWLSINPTCPMCRVNFRKGVLRSILDYLNKIINERQINEQNDISTDKLLKTEENA
jgi:hypothetical protein